MEAIDIADLEESLLDEPFSELANLDDFSTKKPVAPGHADITDEDLMSEADLEELANQLNDEDAELAPYAAAGDPPGTTPWDTVEAEPLPLDLDEAGDDELVMDMARAYIELGDRDGAIEILKEALRKGPESQRASVEAMLAELNG